LASAFAEATEEGNRMTEHGVVGAGVLHGSIQFAFDAGMDWRRSWPSSQGVGGLVRDALFG